MIAPEMHQHYNITQTDSIHQLIHVLVQTAEIYLDAHFLWFKNKFPIFFSFLTTCTNSLLLIIFVLYPERMGY